MSDNNGGMMMVMMMGMMACACSVVASMGIAWYMYSKNMLCESMKLCVTQPQDQVQQQQQQQAPPATCPTRQAGCEYSRRTVAFDGKWQCPAGFEDTRVTWENDPDQSGTFLKCGYNEAAGENLGELQCKKCGTPGTAECKNRAKPYCDSLQKTGRAKQACIDNYRTQCNKNPSYGL